MAEKHSLAFEAWAVRNRYLFLSVTGLFLYVAFLGLRDVWYPGEPDMAEVALAMFNSGDWISPRFMGTVWVDYPPMMYWTATICSHIFGGMSAFTLRLPNALAGISIVLMVCATGTRWFDARTGFWAGFALLISMTFMWQSIGYRPDVLFALGIAPGLLLYTEGALRERGLSLKIAGFACLGFAMLAKGILGLMLPGLVLALWHGARREWKPMFLLVPLSLASAAVFLPWVVGTAQSMGWENILNEFYAQNFGRFASGSRGHARPVWYYFQSFWADLWPWSIMVPWAVIWTVRSGQWRDPRIQLLLWWFGTFLVFLTLAETKRQLYLLPAYPAIVLMLGHWMASVGRPKEEMPAELPPPAESPARYSTLFIAVVFLIAGVGGLGLSVFFDPIIAGRDLNELRMAVANGLRLPAAVLGVVALGASAWTGLAALRGQTRTGLIRTGLSQVAIWAVVLAFVAPAFQPVKSFASQSRWIKQQIGPDQSHIGMVYPDMGLRKRGGFAYEMGGTMVELLDDRAQVEQFFEHYPNSVVLVNEVSIDNIFAGDEGAWQSRTLRTLLVGNTSYAVVEGPAGN